VSIAIISSDKVVFALAFGIPVVIGALMVLWSRPRKVQALWALISVAVIAGTAIVAVAAFRGGTPSSTPAAIATSSPSAVPSVTVAPSTAPPSTPPPTPSTTAVECSPKGTKLQLTASGVTFDTNCLAAPAGKAFTVVFQNKDIGIPHDVHIFSADPAQDPNAQSLFVGDLVTGPDTATYQVSALPSGTYFFHCDVHPTQMFGTFVSG
jgi:plastocyanin